MDSDYSAITVVLYLNTDINTQSEDKPVGKKHLSL